jgi:tetratricopeptide (TPR) repeat protein
MALAATSSGIDVQAALDMLLADNADTSASPIPERAQSRPTQRPQRQPERNGEEGDRRPRRQRTTDSGFAGEREQGNASTDMQKNIQEQADKLLAQASEIGLSVFTRANAFWSQGKEKVQRAYEERKAASGGSSNQVQNARPKWMQDGPIEQDDDGWEGQGGFRDDHDAPQTGLRERLPHDDQQRRRPSSSPQPPLLPPRTGNLLAEEMPTAYRSPYRHGPSRSQQQQQQNNYRPSPSTSSRPTPQRVPSPVQMIHRNVVSASATAIATSTKYKAAGTEMFKLGRFSEAENAYSSAIGAIPDSHLLLVQLYNNRALSRLKTGDYSGTVDDSSYVIKLIGASYHPAREAKVTTDEEGAGVDLADGLMKAYRRRAEAYEGKEKWDLAKKDWEVIAGTEWAAGKTRGDAVIGIGRCRKMATADSSVSATPAPPARIPNRPPQRTKRKEPTSSSGALTKLRAANNAADAEDQERYELKDSVDAKISGWKTGKEDNIRALVASLETVLWAQLGWQKVGMHELVTPAQVKVKYTKAIAKLHPDKVFFLTFHCIDN